VGFLLSSNITWFDGLLITLWGALVALGFRKGLSGLAWVLGLLLIWPVITALGGRGGILALPIGLLLGFLISWVAQRFQPSELELWQALLGAVSGLVVGGLTVAALALSFPIQLGSYPGADMPSSLYDAVGNSLVQRSLSFVWGGPVLLKRYLVPDQVSR
jgi:hypothetical protein